MAQNHPEIDMEYFFTDTGEELPEVYDYLIRLEGYLGKKINRLNPDKDFQYYLKLYNYFLPSAQQRWCTSKLKIHPFEEWIRSDLNEGVSVTSYVAIRFDEPNRMGHQKVHENYNVRFPFQEERIDRSGVMEILDSCGSSQNITVGALEVVVRFVFSKKGGVGKIIRAVSRRI